MAEVPTTGQIALLAVAVLCIAASAVLSLARIWKDAGRSRIAAKALLYWGVALALGVLIWHAARRHTWVPLGDNFDALIWLAVLLALFVAYTQRARPLRGLDWFVLPVVVLLLVAAAVFGRAKPHAYVDSAWVWMHLLSTFGGAVAFTIAGAGGTMYLIANRRLRTKRPLPSSGLPVFGSLERLEHLTRISVAMGFALLSVGLITGLVLALRAHDTNGVSWQWYRSPKVWLALCAWGAYAVVLHAPINPSFRGRRAALLSVFGFVLIVGVLVVVQFMPVLT